MRLPEAIVGAMAAHQDDVDLQLFACYAVFNLVRFDDEPLHNARKLIAAGVVAALGRAAARGSRGAKGGGGGADAGGGSGGASLMSLCGWAASACTEIEKAGRKLQTAGPEGDD